MSTTPEQPAEPTDRLLVLDGRDALAFVVIRPAEEDPESISVEASARGMSKAVAAYALRQTADQFDRAAIAEGDEPITAEEAAEEQQQRPAADPFTEAAVSRAALLAAADTIENLPRDYECDPGRGDAVNVLRRMANFHTTAEQPTGPRWQDRASHAARLYAQTAIERDDARDAAETLRARVAELETETAALQRDKEHVAQAAEARVNGTARRLAEQVTALGKARGWSTWAADYIHPEREFVDTGEQAATDDPRPRIEIDLEQPAEPERVEERPAVPTVVDCAHGYGLMRDSCPGCDHETETPHDADPVTIRPTWAKRNMRRCRRCGCVPSHPIHRAPKAQR